MCGFAGFTYSDKNLLKKMGSTLQKRAIDGECLYTREGYSFYHAHLKISDLDKDTSQPYISDSLIVGLVGEIYNKTEILRQINISESEKKYTELEIIALAYRKLGAGFVNIFNGEFAISIFDISKQKYLLYRDRWGVNNVYYRIYNDEFYFASEIKTLILDTPVCSKKSMVDHLIFQFGISPDTIVQDIYTLRPGTYIVYEDSKICIHDFEGYKQQEISKGIIDTIEKSVIRRIPHFQKEIFVSLSGGPDSNVILFFLKKHYKGKIIAYSFFTDKNNEDIAVAIKNAKQHEIEHLLIDMNLYEYQFLGDDLYMHEGLVYLPDLGKILKQAFPKYKHVKVDFGGDGKEELILGNNHYPYKNIFSRYSYFQKKKLCPSYSINQEFLNKEMFDYNLQMIDKLTLGNGLERRLPFTDYEMLQFSEYKNYRQEVEEFLKGEGISLVQGEYGYNLGIKFKNIYDTDLAQNKNILFSYFRDNILHGEQSDKIKE